MAPEPGDLLRDLKRELAGGAQHEGGGAVPPGGDALEHRDAERGGLAGAGLRSNDDVPPGHDRPEGRGLHRSGRLIAALGDAGAHRFGEVQVVEAGGRDVVGRDGLL